MPQYGNPYGASDLRAGYRAWVMKEQLLTWWGKYLEKFGIPTVVGTYGAAKGYSKQQQSDFLSVVAKVHNESALVVPDDMQIALLDGKAGSGAGASGSGFDELISFLDRSIAKAILGQTLTSDSTK